jgi:hypothetical protein
MTTQLATASLLTLVQLVADGLPSAIAETQR